MNPSKTMARREFLAASAAVPLMATASCAASKGYAMPNARPNVLFILVDQMRADMLGCMGNASARTPNLDALARDGALFTNAVSNCPVCTPSRAMLMTGKYPLSNRTIVNDLPMPTDQPFLAEVFRDAGYKTGHIGKWHLDGVPRTKFTPPGKRRAGFDTYWATYNCHHDYFHPRYYLDTDELVTAEGYEPVVQTDLAIDFMSRYAGGPFFLMLSWGPPHAPYELVPEEFRALYDPASMAYRANCLDVNQREYCDYYAQVAALDIEVGRLLGFLDERGLAENTIVVFTSDHGDMMYSHGRVKKQQPWEECVHIPLILRGPTGVKPGSRPDLLFGVADMAPTLIGMVGLDAPAEMEGWDLSDTLRGNGPEHESLPIFDYVPIDQAWAWNGREWRGVRTKTHTYARYQDAGWVLYDNVKDPYQRDNRIDTSDFADLRARLEGQLQEWLDRMKDAFLTGDEHLRALGQWDLYEERNASFPWSRNRKKT
ncbi:MAG TPA: sulfatase [Candidatus Hydrogenedentes bacterium]|nr:sulfatase [Candidatus Hydrogenedentota bacterium]HPG68304.1 sulfatase [Candidatus Hydrogenedentota bacterium]